MTKVVCLIFRVELVGRADRVEIMMLEEDDRGCMFDFQSGAGRADRMQIRVCLQRMIEVVCLFFRVEQAGQAG